MKFFLLSLLVAAVSADPRRLATAPPTMAGETYCVCSVSTGKRRGTMYCSGTGGAACPAGTCAGDATCSVEKAPWFYGNGVGVGPSPPVANTPGVYCAEPPASGDCSGATCDSTRGRTCKYWQECGKVESNNTLSDCMPKGNFMCPLFQYLSKRETADDGDVAVGNPDGTAAAVSCLPTESCCNGVCCGTNKGCMARESGTFAYNYKYDYDAAQMARNDWKVGGASEEIKNRPMMCMDLDVWMNSTAGLKVIFLPVAGILIIAFCFMQANAKKTGEMAENMAPMLMFFFGFLLMFSHHIMFALFSVIAAATTMSASPSWNGWVLFFQIAFFWFYVGGTSFFLNNEDNASGFMTKENNYIRAFVVSGKGGDITALTGQCTDYFYFFKYGGLTVGPTTTILNKKWMSSAARKSWGYCSQEWVSFMLFAAVMNMVAFFMMIVQTAVKTVSGGGDGRTSQALSAAKV